MHHLAELDTWKPPTHWTKISSIDLHTGGEPLRVITSGLPPIEGSTVLEKRRYFRDNYDHIRTGIMWEPRGHADMYGAILTPSKDADFDVFFLHNEGYSTMCGHAIIALTTLLIDTGAVQTRGDGSDVSGLEIDFSVPAGRIHARATVENGKARGVTFRNVPSFVFRADQQVQVPVVGKVRFDIAYGGAFYAVIDGPALGLDLSPEHASRLIDYGRRIKNAIIGAVSIEHPFEPELSFLYGTIFTGGARNPAHHSRNVCIFADGELDRSSTGSGVSARAALHYAKGELALNQPITIESILGSTMTVRAVEELTYGPYGAVIPEVGGTAFVVGRNEWYFDPNDPFRRGFIVR